MKRHSWYLLSLLLILLLAGCSAGPDYTVKLTKKLYFQQDKAMPIEISVTEHNKVVTGLKISGEFSMANMDHGSTEIELTEGQDGAYSGQITLPMTGTYEAVFTLEKDGEKTEKVIQIKVTKPKGVAKLNEKWITNEELAFYQLINQLQLEINRAAASKQYTGEQLTEELAYLDTQEKRNQDQSQALTQLIRLRSMALLAEEKGHEVSAGELDDAITKARQQYDQFASVQSLISQYGEERFWASEKEHYKEILLSNKIQQELTAQVKSENPTASSQEIDYLAQQQYEELLVTQIDSLKIEII